MREDESVAEATGVSTVSYKLLAFALGATTGCLSGALFAVQLGSVFPGKSFATIPHENQEKVLSGLENGSIALAEHVDCAEFFNLLKAPSQPMLVIGNEGLLKELAGRVRTRSKRGKKKPTG